jgi:hypothetical protein
MINRGLVSLIFFALPVMVFANTPYDFKIEKSPFKTCSGSGDGDFSRYSKESVKINLNQNSIQILRANGTKETYASLKTLCGVNISQETVVCDNQDETTTPSGYYFAKSCSSLIPGTNRTNFQFRLELTLNIREDANSKSAFGSLNCVANQDGFRAINISSCQ